MKYLVIILEKYVILNWDIVILEKMHLYEYFAKVAEKSCYRLSQMNLF